MRTRAFGQSQHVLRRTVSLGLMWFGVGSVSAQQGGSGWYNAPGNYGTSYGAAGYGAVRTQSNFPSPGYGRGLRPYAVAQNQWGSGIWNQGNRMNTYGQVQQPAGRYGTWGAPYQHQQGQAYAQPNPPIGAYAPTVGPGTGLRRRSAY